MELIWGGDSGEPAGHERGIVPLRNRNAGRAINARGKFSLLQFVFDLKTRATSHSCLSEIVFFRDLVSVAGREFCQSFGHEGIMTLLPPTMAQQKRIDAELPPDPEMRKRDVLAIREWIKKQPHLPNHMDDVRLERFLLGCKNSIERCKMILERYFSVRTAFTELFAIRDPLGNDIQECCKSVDYFVLPSLTEEGHRVTVLRLRDTSIDKFNVETLAKRILMVLDCRLLEESCLSNVMIIDLEGFSAMHFVKCSPTHSSSRRAMLAIQDSMPQRLHRIYFLHAPSFIENIRNIFYPLLKEKLVQKFRIHSGGPEELYPYMDRDILPNEWGGRAGSFQDLNDAWKKKIEKSRDWFLREEKLSRTNESLRLPETKPTYLLVELDGVPGSFRKLNID